MEKKYLAEGIHLIYDIYNVDNKLLNDGDFLEKMLVKASELSGATVLGVSKHKFEPAGYSVLVSLSESHASIHTYVDLDNDNGSSAMCDIFTCGNSCFPMKGIDYILEVLELKMGIIIWLN